MLPPAIVLMNGGKTIRGIKKEATIRLPLHLFLFPYDL